MNFYVWIFYKIILYDKKKLDFIQTNILDVFA